MIKITFPDGSVREYNEGVTGLQIAESISSRLAQDVLACGVNGETIDLSRPINEDANFVLYKWEDEQGKHAFWHTSAHLLAEALQELYPGIQFGIGPAIENGFYYDVDPGEAIIKEADLPAIEAKMAELAAKKEILVRQSIAKEDALKKFGERGETYKCELISELEDGHITTYTQGAFTDLCRGPHLTSTAPIKAIKLLSVAGAYWRGQEDRKQMTRIYGITFPKKKMLDEYLVMLEEAKKRDHRKIGKEMDLFMFTDMVPNRAIHRYSPSLPDKPISDKPSMQRYYGQAYLSPAQSRSGVRPHKLPFPLYLFANRNLLSESVLRISDYAGPETERPYDPLSMRQPQSNEDTSLFLCASRCHLSDGNAVYLSSTSTYSQ